MSEEDGEKITGKRKSGTVERNAPFLIEDEFKTKTAYLQLTTSQIKNICIGLPRIDELVDMMEYKDIVCFLVNKVHPNDDGTFTVTRSCYLIYLHDQEVGSEHFEVQPPDQPLISGKIIARFEVTSFSGSTRHLTSREMDDPEPTCHEIEPSIYIIDDDEYGADILSLRGMGVSRILCALLLASFSQTELKKDLFGAIDEDVSGNVLGDSWWNLIKFHLNPNEDNPEHPDYCYQKISEKFLAGLQEFVDSKTSAETSGLVRALSLKTGAAWAAQKAAVSGATSNESTNLLVATSPEADALEVIPLTQVRREMLDAQPETIKEAVGVKIGEIQTRQQEQAIQRDERARRRAEQKEAVAQETTHSAKRQRGGKKSKKIKFLKKRRSSKKSQKNKRKSLKKMNKRK
jgi:hypothetical protein